VTLAGERGEAGLIQLLVAMTLFAIVLGATLITFQNFDMLSRRNVDRSASQDSARSSVDRLVRDLRNLASPTIEQPQAVDVASDYDLVFQTVDSVGPNTGANAANVKRVRWCLDNTVPADEKLMVQEQRWTTLATPVAPSTAACPGTGWTTTSTLAQNVTNRYNGQSRPLFGFNSATLTAINEIHVDVFSDLNPLKNPSETHITSGVFLRNQNASPIAAFTSAVSGATAIVLNGSPSYDPEGQGLTYVWLDGGVKKGDGVTFTLPVTSNTNHTIQLKVFDPAGLEGDSATKSIHVP
jgi:type II secretory pathway component PulJ